jgi:hypothetical protein
MNCSNEYGEYLTNFVENWNSPTSLNCSEPGDPKLVQFLYTIKNRNKPMKNWCKSCISIRGGILSSPYISLEEKPLYYHIPDISANGKSTGPEDKLVKTPVSDSSLGSIDGDKTSIRTVESKEPGIYNLYIKVPNCNGFPLPVYTDVSGPNFIRITDYESIPETELEKCPECKQGEQGEKWKWEENI